MQLRVGVHLVPVVAVLGAGLLHPDRPVLDEGPAEDEARALGAQGLDGLGPLPQDRPDGEAAAGLLRLARVDARRRGAGEEEVVLPLAPGAAPLALQLEVDGVLGRLVEELPGAFSPHLAQVHSPDQGSPASPFWTGAYRRSETLYSSSGVSASSGFVAGRRISWIGRIAWPDRCPVGASNPRKPRRSCSIVSSSRMISLSVRPRPPRRIPRDEGEMGGNEGRDGQSLGDLLVLETLGEQLEDVELAVGQVFEGAPIADGRPSGRSGRSGRGGLRIRGRGRPPGR